MKRINDQLNSKLVATSRRLAMLTMKLRNELPPECDGHYHVANIQNRTIIIVTDSPVWTTRLRQLGPLILQTLTGDFQQPPHHVRVISRHGPVMKKNSPAIVKRNISPQSRQTISQTASYIDDEKLKAALLKISRRGQK